MKPNQESNRRDFRVYERDSRVYERDFPVPPRDFPVHRRDSRVDERHHRVREVASTYDPSVGRTVVEGLVNDAAQRNFQDVESVYQLPLYLDVSESPAVSDTSDGKDSATDGIFISSDSETMGSPRRSSEDGFLLVSRWSDWTEFCFLSVSE